MAKRKTKKKAPTIPTNSHDSLFKLTFGTKEIVMDYMDTFFPAELRAGMEYNGMRLETNTYIDETLRNYLSDVVWLIPFKGMEISPVFLFEHKSNPDSNVLVQVLRYMLCVWEHDLRQKKGAKLRVVIPIIVYHGKDKWELKPFEELFGDVSEDLKKYIPKFDFLFENLVDIPDEVLRALKNASTFAALITLARAYNIDFHETYLIEVANRLAIGPMSAGKRNLLKTILVYTFRISKKKADEITSIIENLPPTLKPTIMNMYDNIVELGYEKGIQKGMEKGMELKNLETIRKGFKKGMSIEDLADLTDLPESKVIDIIEHLKLSGEL